MKFDTITRNEHWLVTTQTRTGLPEPYADALSEKEARALAAEARDEHPSRKVEFYRMVELPRK